MHPLAACHHAMYVSRRRRLATDSIVPPFFLLSNPLSFLFFFHADADADADGDGDGHCFSLGSLIHSGRADSLFITWARGGEVCVGECATVSVH